MKLLDIFLDCNALITRELIEARVQIVQHPQPIRYYPPVSVTGRLGKYTFVRAGYYWTISGPVPLTLARKMYNESGDVGRYDIHAEVFDSSRPPDDYIKVINWSEFYQILGFDPSKGSEALDNIVEENDAALRILRPPQFPGDLLRFGHKKVLGCIAVYHIDSQEGLNLFANIIRNAGLVSCPGQV